MSKSDKEHYQKLLNNSIEELVEVKGHYSKLLRILDELENDPTVKKYLKIKYQWNEESEIVAAAERRVATWTYCLTQIKE
jgi:hypothetical protein